MIKLPQSRWQEALVLFRFGMVGAVATALHMFALTILASNTHFPILLINTFSFFFAFLLSFFGHYFLTFRTSGHLGRAIQRFFLVSGSAFIVNTLVLATLLEAEILPPLHAAIASLLIIPAITYLASRLWVFGSEKSGSGNHRRH
jgi:putative flippase GtrA